MNGVVGDGCYFDIIMLQTMFWLCNLVANVRLSRKYQNDFAVLLLWALLQFDGNDRYLPIDFRLG